MKPMNSPSDPLLEIKDLHTYYGRSHVIQGLSLTVQPGETVSILGRNGVGKTTTLRTIIGLTPPKSGTIWIDGEDTTHWPPHRIARKGVAYIPAERHIFPGLSVEENLRLAAKSSGAEGFLERRAGLRPVPYPAGTKKAGRLHPERRGAADVSHRPRPHEQSPHDAAG